MSEPQVFFLDSSQGPGQRFCIFHPADPRSGPERGRVLHIHPFAEEMNKSRRMAALQARQMAAAGFAVLQIDLFGCGDSAGDFGEAGWQDWLADLRQAKSCLDSKCGGASPLWLWGQRVGCLLASELAQQMGDEACNFLFWQPPANGRLLLQQFLRLKLAGSLLEGNAAAAMEALKAQMAAGEVVEIAGYGLSPALAAGLEKATLTPPAGGSGRALFFELASQAGDEVSPALASSAQRWQAAGLRVQTQRIQGPSFWQTSEIEDAPALLSASLQALLMEGAPA
ncbi:hydrolase 2, exosortase A system-associated [Paucibacter sp. KBW04]|uniref:hydrolase 2, exosortase A system-associated n=1 Tax=Paucibacter sp. KBW04 TaxID=2153361 RepID=UPI000F566866|nr:hydrolase 2, exosortase A system-associated [Paucibacter sp. KBW04]RQO58683.1 hydrolase 2, exosortase A system-associated [Paucibacter sp. KBW04]